MADEKKPEVEDETDPPLTQKQLNAALADSKKRTEKMIADALKSALEPFTKARESKPVDDPDEKTNTVKAAEARAQKRIEELERKFADSEKRAKDEADGRRRDSAQSQLRSHFEGANVRKEALDVLVAAATVNGMLRYDDDGKPLISVKRARAKGAAAEEQTFEDFKQGVDDWAKSPEAAAFIKAPTVVAAKVGQTREGTRPRYEKQITSEEEGIDRVLDLITSGTD